MLCASTIDGAFGLKTFYYSAAICLSIATEMMHDALRIVLFYFV